MSKAEENFRRTFLKKVGKIFVVAGSGAAGAAERNSGAPLHSVHPPSLGGTSLALSAQTGWPVSFSGFYTNTTHGGVPPREGWSFNLPAKKGVRRG